MEGNVNTRIQQKDTKKKTVFQTKYMEGHPM